MSENIHVIVRMSGDGVYATSPQAPGLAYGRPTLEELRAGLQDVLAFHFSRPGPFEVTEHHERHYEVAGRELVTALPTMSTGLRGSRPMSGSAERFRCPSRPAGWPRP